MSRGILQKMLLLTTSTLLSALALANAHAAGHAEGHGGHGEGALHINWWAFDPHAPALGWLLIDFAIFVFIIYWFGRKPISAFLQQRSDSIHEALEQAQRAKAEAEAKAAELEQRVKALDGELQQLRDDIKSLGEKERDQLVREAQKASTRMIEDADMQIQNQLQSARESLKNQALDQALAQAEQLLRAQLSAADYSRLNDEFTRSLVEAGHKAEEVSQ